MTYDVVSAALAELCAAHPELIDPGPAQQQESTVWSDAPPTGKVELNQRLIEDLESTAAALVACEAIATSTWDDERRWDALAGAVSAVVQEWPERGLELLDAIGVDHELSAQAVIRGWTVSSPSPELAVRIVERTAGLHLEPIVGWVTAMIGGFAVTGTVPVEWFTHSESETLAQRCWTSIEPTRPSSLQGSDDLTMTALNHPAGQLAEYWVDRVGHLWRASGDSWRGLPPEIANYLADLISSEGPRSDAVAIRFCRYLAFFHQADPTWSKQNLVPLFDWDNSSRSAIAWSGYLSQGQWTNRLLAERILEMAISTVGHRDQLDKPGQRALPAFLARLAVAADINPLTWLRDFVTCSTVADRVAWAQGIRHQLSSLDPVEAELQWERWIRTYLLERVGSIPRRLDPEEASAMASWPLFLCESMTTAIDLMLSAENAGLELHNLFLHDLGQRQVSQAPESSARLLHHLLKRSEGQIHYAHSVIELHALFREAGVTADLLHQIEEEATRLGFTI
ncbi:DUF4020 domain-containing protein [Mycobacterium sp. ITM-2016-00316]|uniref:DUF4020 domain-containing protein n=1 Tax=Mycobacterium sp. ITM-2016-00316 TaxID=2099695 RepID=UPI000CF85F64|nr:DUF4020 domain-containing protein [Mycobacterium sp. ITM-2016-00316]WNG82391.1 DUF4020 domain-containing protein [Mycobacterium sp. ITM-2016-00316]